MRAAKSVMDLVAGQPRQLSGSDHQQMVINLYDDYLMVFTANHNKNPETETGKVDWRRVSRIKIIGIERENGS